MTAALPAEPDRAGPRGRRPPARNEPLGHLHLPPDDRDRRRLRPGHRPARRRDRRRRRRDRGLRGTDRRADARRHRERPVRPRADVDGDGAQPVRPTRCRASGPATSASARSCPTSRSTSIRARSSASSPSRARARTSCSTSWPDRSARAAASSSVDGGRVVVPPSGRRDPGRPGLRPGRSCRGPPDAALRPREHRPAVLDALPGRGGRSTSAEERRKVDARDRDAPDRHPGRLRGPPPVGRQPAEGHDRALGRGRRPDDALLRPDARASTSARSSRSTSSSATSRRAGAAVLLYTSELKEIQLACDRAIVIFRGRIVAEIPVAEADEPTLLRAAYDLKPDAAMPEARRPSERSEAAATRGRAGRAAIPTGGPGDAATGIRRDGAVETRSMRPPERLDVRPGRPARRVPRVHEATSSRTTARPASRASRSRSCPIAFAAVAQAIVVISGGIDLSVGSMMALASVTSAVLMKDQGDAVRRRRRDRGPPARPRSSGRSTALLVVITKVPDIVVTLAMSFVWAGTALLVLNTPGGGAAPWLMAIISGPLGQRVAAEVASSSWRCSSRSSGCRSGARTWGSTCTRSAATRLAAFRSGVAVAPTKVVAYALTGFFSALGGLALTATGGVGAPVPGSYTLQSVAADRARRRQPRRRPGRRPRPDHRGHHPGPRPDRPVLRRSRTRTGRRRSRARSSSGW